ncbi:PqqD family protein [Nocardioides sp. LS1]|uniref:PqqD family protein n=1 Tax=Nocardioides sp. LS1 TaxID=1027620 RepID=UPI00163A676E|nr:PqqD family protein [Nocardioides sp. LS1]
MRRSEDVAFVESDERVALLDLAALQDPPVVLSGTAAHIWRLLDGSRTLDEVVAHLAVEYAVEPHVISPDVQRFVADLTRRGLVQAYDTNTPEGTSND